jgi:hypothetical protein
MSSWKSSGGKVKISGGFLEGGGCVGHGKAGGGSGS